MVMNKFILTICAVCLSATSVFPLSDVEDYSGTIDPSYPPLAWVSGSLLTGDETSAEIRFNFVGWDTFIFIDIYYAVPAILGTHSYECYSSNGRLTPEQPEIRVHHRIRIAQLLDFWPLTDAYYSTTKCAIAFYSPLATTDAVDLFSASLYNLPQKGKIQCFLGTVRGLPARQGNPRGGQMEIANKDTGEPLMTVFFYESGLPVSRWPDGSISYCTNTLIHMASANTDGLFGYWYSNLRPYEYKIVDYIKSQNSHIDVTMPAERELYADYDRTNPTKAERYLNADMFERGYDDVGVVSNGWYLYDGMTKIADYGDHSDYTAEFFDTESFFVTGSWDAYRQAATVRVWDKGGYSTPLVVEVEDIYYGETLRDKPPKVTYNGRVAPGSDVFYNKTLTDRLEYDWGLLNESDNSLVDVRDQILPVGRYTLYFRGQGEYDRKNTEATLVVKDRAGELTIEVVDTVYPEDCLNGDKAPKVSFDGIPLTDGVDYDWGWMNNTNITDIRNTPLKLGTYPLYFQGLGYYARTSGSARVVVAPRPGALTVEMADTIHITEYLRDRLAPIVRFEGEALADGTDYDWGWLKNADTVDVRNLSWTQVGTYRLLFWGKGKYAGKKVEETFVVAQLSGSLSVDVADSIYYGQKLLNELAPIVWYGNQKLRDTYEYDWGYINDKGDIVDARTNLMTLFNNTLTFWGLGLYTGLSATVPIYVKRVGGLIVDIQDTIFYGQYLRDELAPVVRYEGEGETLPLRDGRDFYWELVNGSGGVVTDVPNYLIPVGTHTLSFRGLGEFAGTGQPTLVPITVKEKYEQASGQWVLEIPDDIYIDQLLSPTVKSNSALIPASDYIWMITDSRDWVYYLSTGSDADAWLVSAAGLWKIRVVPRYGYISPLEQYFRVYDDEYKSTGTESITNEALKEGAAFYDILGRRYIYRKGTVYPAGIYILNRRKVTESYLNNR
ncbi:MAG: hypothetical protein MdMp024_1207 [Bacteroidales bacterium]